MKRALSAMFLALALAAGCAAPASVEQMKHQRVREYPGLTKQQIFDGVMRTIAKEFRSAKDVIQHSDASSGMIVAKGIMPSVCAYDALGALRADCDFTLTVDVKDGRARYSYDGLAAYSKDRNRLSGVDGSADFHVGAGKAFVALEAAVQNELATKDSW